MTLTKEQKAALAEQLSMPWGSAELMCDGFLVTLRVERSKGLSYRVMTYVNGVWRGTWFSAKEAHPEQRFMRPVSRYLFPAKFRRDMLKLLGKRRYAAEDYDRKHHSYTPDWPSGKAAINHLCKVCESIEVLP